MPPTWEACSKGRRSTLKGTWSAKATCDIVELFMSDVLLGSKQTEALHQCRSARVGDEIGGHNVSGHVHTTAEVVQIEDTENNRRVTFKVLP